MIDILDLTADVLVAGGGPAGAWAALKAAQAGADVILVDKGYTGTSGATASAGTGVWYVEPQAREAAMASREHLNGHLSDRRWMARVLDQTYANIHELATTGRYPFPILADGSELRRGVQGPEYMRRMRAWLKRGGVRVLDHSPALELLTDPTGAVAGVAGHRRQLDQPYRVRAGAVVLATGGCAFLSRALGCDVNTGDGALFAAEVGATLSGMEFSNAYAIAPEFSSVTKTAYYNYATFYREDGTVLEGAASQSGRSVIARALLNERVFARLDLADDTVRAAMRRGQPNFFLPFDRMRIDPFEDRFPITLLLEGTVRGTGGVRVVDDDCSTGVPGLYVAGDVATRELICGGFTGGGSHNSAWAMSSGTWAGTAAARHAAALGTTARRRRPVSAGQAGLRPTGVVSGDHREVVRAVQAETHPYLKNYLRRGDRLDQALATLDELWADTRAHLHGSPVEARQAAAMVAHARWMYTAALARTESRGMHKRLDHPGTDPSRRHRLLVGGLDELWTAADPVRPHTPLDLAVAS
ncbi:FAD-dependent oxidoreductase [Actinoplanes regularis]|uniref:L-aspartate oxidase n=1 Tax=Actinoplanes regularis TaxID=52697 RepID=A0A238Z3C5_9ACTN|nr:FAD-binding protein [Actinoplanes regularis]GIE85753.1 pyridine nucleotide-disulfide oxidoreductase [Actinoplanes regularis]SNR77411.1 Succinate dehydrogenase/fumarate reductase, flavoprotein subunit [Actinoplanes regularis]